MLSRRDFLQVAAATAAILPGSWTRAFAQQRLTQDELLRFEPLGNVTLLHIADMHAQLVPVISASRRSISASARPGAAAACHRPGASSTSSTSRRARRRPMR